MLSSRRLASGRAAARFGIWRGPEVMIFDQKSPKYVPGNFEIIPAKHPNSGILRTISVHYKDIMGTDRNMIGT